MTRSTNFLQGPLPPRCRRQIEIALHETRIASTTTFRFYRCCRIKDFHFRTIAQSFFSRINNKDDNEGGEHHRRWLNSFIDMLNNWKDNFIALLFELSALKFLWENARQLRWRKTSRQRVQKPRRIIAWRMIHQNANRSTENFPIIWKLRKLRSSKFLSIPRQTVTHASHLSYMIYCCLCLVLREITSTPAKSI